MKIVEHALRKLAEKFLYFHEVQIDEEIYEGPSGSMILEQDMVSDLVCKDVKDFIQESDCSVCFGIYRQPVVMCSKCLKCICKETCYKPMVRKDCPSCNTPLFEEDQNSNRERKLIGGNQYQCKLQNCEGFG